MSAAPSVPAPLVRTQHIGDESAIDLGELVLVASKTTPGAWYQVQNGTCSCKGFQYRSTCRHLEVAEQARQVHCHRCGEPARPSTVGTPICGPCSLTLAWAVD